MIQRTFKLLGDGGCYFFCLWKLIKDLDMGVYHDPLMMYEMCVSQGLMQEDGYILEPHTILQRYLGGKWMVRKEGPDYQPKEGEYQVLRYGWTPRPGVEVGHFVLPDWDPLGESETAKHGTLVSKRILWRV